MTNREAKTEQHRLFPRQTWRLVSTSPETEGTAENPIRTWGHTPTLPEICLNARASITGAADPWADTFLTEVRAMLTARIATWYREDAPVEDYVTKIDDCVKEMCRATITMISDELDRRAREGYTIESVP